MGISQKEINFKEYLIQGVSLCVENEALINHIFQSFTVINLKKNDFLVKENQICPYFCFVETGILQHAILVNV